MADLTFYVSTMNAGKSHALITSAFNYKNHKFIATRPYMDGCDDKIASRTGLELPCDYIIYPKDSIYELFKDDLEDCKKIFVDEAQLLTPDQVDELYAISKDYNIPIDCYGIKNDFKSELFAGSKRLFEIADCINTSLKAMCECLQIASQNARYINDIPVYDGDQVLINNGKNQEIGISYKSLCGDCYYKLVLSKKLNRR